MATHERKIRIAWVETDAPPPVVEEAPPTEAPVVVDGAATGASDERVWSIFLWVAACTTIAAVQGWILPAFAKMFREVGVSVPALTEAVLGMPSMIFGLGVLSILHAAAITRSAETRGRLRVAAFLAVLLGAALTIYGLFAPLDVGIQPL